MFDFLYLGEDNFYMSEFNVWKQCISFVVQSLCLFPLKVFWVKKQGLGLGYFTNLEEIIEN